MISIKLFPARNGEALLIKSNDAAPRTAVLVDGGYASTFEGHIHAELNFLAQRGYCLDLVVATHVDADHVSGLLALFKTNGNCVSPKIIPIREVWHNSLRSLGAPLVGTSSISDSDKGLLTEICRRGFPVPASGTTSEISARQGSSLAALLLGGGYRWNGGDGTQSVCLGSRSCDLGPRLRATPIGPPAERLGELNRWWTSEIRRLGFTGTVGAGEQFDDAFEFLSAYKDLSAAVQSEQISQSISPDRILAEVHVPDDSIINGSTISLILEAGSQRFLFLGDAWPRDVDAVLSEFIPADRPIFFDAIKVAHHGSLRNTSPALLDLIDSPRYLICTNGERHQHPDIQVLKAIVDRPAPFRREIYFNYSTPASQHMKSYVSKVGADFLVIENWRDWIHSKPNSQP